jgi:rhamnosyltransferase
MSVKATIFIPTWFGEQYLDEVLKAVFAQKVNFEYEVLIYDTSSTDRTPKIIDKYAKKHSNLRHKTIAKAEFGHGKTRDEAAHDARGEFVVFLTQDATPAHQRWLYEMLKPFEISNDIVAVLGKQEPRPKAVPLLKGEIKAVFGNLGNESGTTIYYLDDFAKTQGQKDMISFYSDVNSASRRDFLVNTVRYKHVPYAEDQLFGKDVIKAGYKKAYAPRASVVHTNDIKLSEYKHRMFDETLGLRRTGFDIKTPARRTILKIIVKGVFKDWIRTIKDPQYSPKRKLYWLAFNPFYHVEKWRGVHLATIVDLNNDDSTRKNSLESIRHRKKL